MPRFARLASAGLVLAAFALLSPGTAEGAWRWPVRGEVVGEFEHSRRTPFAAGQRRGIDIAARPGVPVGAACRGRVTFAGRLPGGGRGVTVRCASLAATHLGLARILVRRGARVSAGATLGSAGDRGTVRLGARVATERFGYVDPQMLLGPDTAPGGGPGPLGRAPGRQGEHEPRESPLQPPSLRAVPARPAPAAHGVPAAGWAGLALLAAGLPVGGLARARRRRRVTRRGLARVPR